MKWDRGNIWSYAGEDFGEAFSPGNSHSAPSQWQQEAEEFMSALESLGDGPRDYVTRDRTSTALELPAASETRPSRSSSARLTWVNMHRSRASNGSRQLYYLVPGPVDDPDRFDLKVENTNSSYNHKRVRIKVRFSTQDTNGNRRVIRLPGATGDWKTFRGRELANGDDRTIPLTLTRETLLQAYNSNSPRCWLDVEYHWAEYSLRRRDASHYYNRKTLQFFLMMPYEFLFSRKRTIGSRVALRDPRYLNDYWKFVTGVRFSRAMHSALEVSISGTSRVARSRSRAGTTSSSTTTTQSRSHSTTDTFGISVSGEVSRGGSASANIEIFELGVSQMIKLGGSMSWSHAVTTTQSSSRANQIARSLTLSSSYTNESSSTISTRTSVGPMSPGTLVKLYLYPEIQFYAVPYVRFTRANDHGQANRSPQRIPMLVPVLKEWLLRDIVQNTP